MRKLNIIALCLSVICLAMMAGSAFAANLLIDLKASDLANGSLASWANLGTLGGSLDPYIVAPTVETVAGKKAVTFNGSNTFLKSTFTSPSSITGQHAWSVAYWVYNPTFQGDEYAFGWARINYTGTNGANFGIGNYWRAIDHSSGITTSFILKPVASAWQHIAVTYDGSDENLYLNGLLNETASGRILNIYPNDYMIIGSGVDWNGGWTDWNRFSGSISSLKVYDAALTSAEVAALIVTAKHTITVTAGTGGSINPGTMSVDEGDSPTFTITPGLGYKILDVKVDSVSNPGALASGSYTFNNVTSAHTIEASFEQLAPQIVSGKVTNGTAGISGAKVYFKTSANASFSPIFTSTTNELGNYSQSLPPGSWYICASADGYDLSADSTIAVSAMPVTLSDIALTANPNWDVIFKLNTDELNSIADGARIFTWGGMPARETFNNNLPMLGPVAETINGVKWEKNVYSLYDGSVTPSMHMRRDGFLFGNTTTASINVNGISALAVVRPKRGLNDRGWTPVIDVLFGEFRLGVRNDDGRVILERKTKNPVYSTYVIPEGQKTVLSAIVQPDGSYQVWANGISIMTGGAIPEGCTLLVNGSGTRRLACIGTSEDDGWATYIGNIGDVYLYKNAISDSKRRALEEFLSTKFGVESPKTITASAGPNGTISPTGIVGVPYGTDKAFTIAPNAGYVITDVFVDGASVGAVNSYTFNNITANHTISATFGVAIIASAGVNGTIAPSGIVPVTPGMNKVFTITPSPGYKIYKVLVDGNVDAAAKTSGSYTFTNVTSAHTISAQFLDQNVDESLLIDIQASNLTLGTDMSSWPNAGVLGGSFDKFASGVGPNVIMIAGKKAVEFIQPTDADSDRRTLVSTVPAPLSLSGNHPWTVSTDLFKADMASWSGPNAYLSWAGQQNGDARSSAFKYGFACDAYTHGNANGTFSTLPTAGQWHNVTITFDGTTESIYVDGILDGTPVARTLNIAPSKQIMVGSTTDNDTRTNDNYWRFNGALASLKVFEKALTKAEVEAISGVVPIVTYTITASAAANGNISPSGNTTLADGGSQLYAIIPDSGYRVADVLVDGVSVGAVTSYTFINVTASHTISATFASQNQITGNLSFATMSQAAYACDRDVVFVATDPAGVELKTWTVPVSFTNIPYANDIANCKASGSYVLIYDLPANAVKLSAKTDWTLRQRVALTFVNGRATADFTLLGGDVNNTNSVNILDYTLMKSNWGTNSLAVDINGDGNSIGTPDYNIMKSNWFKVGDEK